ncbi:hypothetical protein ACPCAG_19250 [Streptomyces pseudogriseolus]|uniref:hypothetical protein n=1 Tax=Streptomyces pseudogriseolus TaxID=36817 RepID=UPI003FA1ECD3
MTADGLLTARPESAALDDHGVGDALDGLVDGGGYWTRAGSLGAIERTGRYLATGKGDPGTAGEGSWTAFIGRVGSLALRAAVEPTREDRRQRLLALLEIWAAAPFADPSARIRTGLVHLAQDGPEAVRDERGAAVAVGWAAGGLRRFVDLRAGAAQPPSLGTVEEAGDVPRGGWGRPGQIRRLVDLIRERGPVPWDRGAVEALRQGTGMSRAEASYALAGLLRGSLGDEERAVHGLKVTEIEDCVRGLGRTRPLDRLDLLADVLPEDPAGLWEPGAMHLVADRLARAWRQRHGRRTVVPERTYATVIELHPFPLSAARLCATFTDHASIRGLGTDLDTGLTNSEFGPYATAGGGWELSDFGDTLHALARTVFRVYAELPAGDPVRAGAPGLLRSLRRRLDHPGLLLNAGRLSHTVGHRLSDVHARFGTRPYAVPEPLDVEAVDDGLTVAVDGTVDRRGERSQPSLYFRPAYYGADERSERLLAARAGRPSDPEFAVVEWLRGPACERLVQRLEDPLLPPGSYETNPALSAPGVLKKAADTLGLDEDATTLYLQLLTLYAPTDRNIRTWNGWKPARHQQAAATLLDRGLVVEDKRPRAGRRLFLGGEWLHADKPYQPMEPWKADLLGLKRSYNGRLNTPLPLPTRTLPELFAHACTLVESGRQPSVQPTP